MRANRNTRPTNLQTKLRMLRRCIQLSLAFFLAVQLSTLAHAAEHGFTAHTHGGELCEFVFAPTSDDSLATGTEAPAATKPDTAVAFCVYNAPFASAAKAQHLARAPPCPFS